MFANICLLKFVCLSYLNILELPPPPPPPSSLLLLLQPPPSLKVLLLVDEHHKEEEDQVEVVQLDDEELDSNLLVLCLHPQVLLLYLLAQLEVDPLLYLLALRLDDGLLVADGLLL